MTTYTKLTDFFPADMFAEILNAAERGTKHAQDHSDLPLIIDIQTFKDGHIQQYIDKFFDNLGYNTEKSVCRLQGTKMQRNIKYTKIRPVR